MILQFRELSLFNEGIDDLQFEIMIGKYLEMKNSPHNDGDNDDDKKLQPIIEKVNCDYNRLSWFSDRFLFISDNLTELSIINNQFTEFPLIITRVPNLRYNLSSFYYHRWRHLFRNLGLLTAEKDIIDRNE